MTTGREDRLEWVLNYVNEHRMVDILNADFVASYIEEFPHITHQITPYGANRCAQAGRDLKTLYDRGELKRHRAGIPYDMRGMGFPLWVWMYQPVQRIK